MTAGGHPSVVVVEDAQALAETAATRLLARVVQAKDRAAICLTGGSSPEGLYRLLASEPYRSALPWTRVHWFIGDERFVPADDPLNNFGQARRAFLDRVEVPIGNIHPIATNTDSPDTAAHLYEGELKRFYGADRLDPTRPLFDLVLMGLGSDGHTASLFPGAPALKENERWVVGVEEAGLDPFVPRVTLTIPALASTREMLLLVSGHNKGEALRRVLAGDDLPASRARSDGELIWLVDRDAAEKASYVSPLLRGQ
jgi:6-phosphogluconolactonase